MLVARFSSCYIQTYVLTCNLTRTNLDLKCYGLDHLFWSSVSAIRRKKGRFVCNRLSTRLNPRNGIALSFASCSSALLLRALLHQSVTSTDSRFATIVNYNHNRFWLTALDTSLDDIYLVPPSILRFIVLAPLAFHCTIKFP